MELNTLKKEIKKFKVDYMPFNCDVNDYNRLKSFITKLKKLDILVNNAGTNIPEPFLNVKKSSLETLNYLVLNQGLKIYGYGANKLPFNSLIKSKHANIG